MADFEHFPHQLGTARREVSTMGPETTAWFLGLDAKRSTETPRDQLAGLRSRASYVIANNDWPAAEMIQSDEEAYEALVGAFHSVTDETYNSAMRALMYTQTPLSELDL